MRRMKKVLAAVMMLALLMGFTMSVPALAAEDEFTVHAMAPADWTAPGLWAWSAPDGTNVFTAWPGEKLNKDETNEGWYYYSIPSWANSIIINDEGVQTVDVTIESKELWITVTEAGADGKFAAEVVYEAPEGFQTAEAAAEELPKTGDISQAYLWLALVFASGFGYIVFRRRKTA